MSVKGKMKRLNRQIENLQKETKKGLMYYE